MSTVVEVEAGASVAEDDEVAELDASLVVEVESLVFPGAGVDSGAETGAETGADTDVNPELSIGMGVKTGLKTTPSSLKMRASFPRTLI